MNQVPYRHLLALVASLTTTQALTQYLPGLMNSNYGGVYRMLQNPSAATGGRYKYQFVLGLGSSTINSTYFKYFTSNDLFHTLRLPYSNELSRDLRSVGSITDAPRTTTYSEIIGPSILFNIDQVQSIVLHTRLRNYFYGSSLPKPLTEAYRNRLFSSKVSPVAGDFNANLTNNTYTEIGLSYGLQVFDGKWHRLKLGATLRRLSGAQLTTFQATGKYAIQQQNEEKLLEITNLHYGVDYTSARRTYSFFSGNGGSGWGYDFGVTYEIGKRKWGSYYTGKTPTNDPRPAYLIRLSASLMNGGQITYPQSHTISGTENKLTFSQPELERFGDAPLDYLVSLKNAQPATVQEGTPGKVTLPRMVHFEADLRLLRSFFINGLLMQNLSARHTNTPMPNMLIFTPRFEDEDAELALPVSVIGAETKVAIGMSVRLGPVAFGLSDVGRIFKRNGDNHSSIAWFGLSIWGWKRNK